MAAHNAKPRNSIAMMVIDSVRTTSGKLKKSVEFVQERPFVNIANRSFFSKNINNLESFLVVRATNFSRRRLYFASRLR